MTNWGGNRGKYLSECGFGAFLFGQSGCGVDVCTSDDEVASGVTLGQSEQIIAYLERLEKRVQQHIDIHYEVKAS